MKAFTLKKKVFLSPPFPRLTHLHTNGKFWPKLYIPSTIKVNTLSNESCILTRVGSLILAVLGHLAVMALLKLSAILLKYPSLERGFCMFSWAKQILD